VYVLPVDPIYVAPGMVALVTPTSSVMFAVIVTVSVGSDVGREMVVVLAERLLIVGPVESTYDF
jgi:hypothetical protein